MPNRFRRPFGPGWALAGDAGYTKDPITAQGITDAFRDAELCTAALRQAFTGTVKIDEAMGANQHRPDEQVLPIFEFTTQLATLEPSGPELQQVLGAVHGNHGAMDDFASLTAGTRLTSDIFRPGEHRPNLSTAHASR